MSGGADALAVAEARRWLGTAYCHQGSVRGGGADCLGLLRGVWRALYGAEPAPVPPYTPDWAEPGRDEVLMRAAARHLLAVPADVPDRPGMVLLFRMRRGGVAKHLGILSRVTRDGRWFIHAYSGHGVVESALSAPWARRIAARYAFPPRD